MTRARFRVAGLEDVRTMLDWAAEEGWNPGLDDAEAFLAADPEGFFVADVDGTPVAAISVVSHAADMAFLGLYICRPDWRGHGVGYALWQHALAHAGTRTVGLDGVAAQQANYAKSGFALAGSTIRYEGPLDGEAHETVRGQRQEDLPAVQDLDTLANGYARTAWLSAWTEPLATRKTLVLDRGDAPKGFATIRRCRQGVKIGPIVAETHVDALLLARAAIAEMPSGRAIIDVPSERTAFTDLLRGLGFSETFATARMYRGPRPHPSDAMMAVGSMELG